MDFSEKHQDDLLELNALRATKPSARRDELERQFNTLFAADQRLAVYGSLAPGRENEAQLRDLSGDWIDGCHVTGDLVDSGWGKQIGYPALRWSFAGAAVPIQLFVSRDLPRHWARLDEFEGADYLRIVVPVHSDDGVIALANLYAAR